MMCVILLISFYTIYDKMNIMNAYNISNMNFDVLNKIKNSVLYNLPDYKQVCNGINDNNYVYYNSYTDNEDIVSLKLTSYDYILDNPYYIKIMYFIDDVIYNYYLYDDFCKLDLHQYSNKISVIEDIKYDTKLEDLFPLELYLHYPINHLLDISVLNELKLSLSKYNTKKLLTPWYVLRIYNPRCNKDILNIINPFIEYI